MYARLEEIASRAAKPREDAIRKREERVSDRLRPVLEQIREHFYEPGYTVTRLKADLKRGNWLFTRFGQELGFTPWSFIQECRMEMAVRLLRDTAIPVVEVAFLVGYEEFSAFRRLCLQWCGLTPARLREHLRRARALLRELPEGVLSRSHLEKLRRGELGADQARQMIRHCEKVCGPT